MLPNIGVADLAFGFFSASDGLCALFLFCLGDQDAQELKP